MEHAYDFRRAMLQIHKPDLRNLDVAPSENEFVLNENSCLCLPVDAGRVLRRAALDMQDYLSTSMGVPVCIRTYENLTETYTGDIVYTLSERHPIELGEGNASRGYRIDCTDRVVITGYDECGAMQGSFLLEEIMSMRRAPYLVQGTRAHHQLFSPRMVHSGYAEDEYPDAHLAAIAHAGIDTILVTAGGINSGAVGMTDFNELCDRAAEYGLNVYIYSYLPAALHPDDPDAPA